MRLLPLSKKSIKQAIEVLKSGGVVAHPTDTCYGLAADITNSEAINKVIRIKQMAKNKPISIAVSNISKMEEYGIMGDYAKNIASKYLPGALTLVLPKTKNVPDSYFPKDESIGIRIPAHKLTQNFVSELGKPITTTSANITKKENPYTGKEVYEMFKNEDIQPDLILDTDRHSNTQKPSTVVKIIGHELEVIRQGDVVVEEGWI